MARTIDVQSRPASAGTGAVAQAPRGHQAWLTGAVLVLSAAAVLARLPLVGRPLSPDEGGFLMVAQQWSPGPSLYGSYWVDRPPLLITLFQLAGALGGGAVGLRALGAVCAGTSVLLAAALARTVARVDGRSPRSPLVTTGAAATAAVFLVSPLFGASEVDGELLAVPFALAGLVAVLHASTTSRRWLSSWAAAGALGVCAAGVKQNMLEVFVAAAVVLVARSRRAPARTVLSFGAFALGAGASAAVLMGWAALHGTSPAGLWDAIVTFRLEASSVIARSAPATTHTRALGVAGAFAASGALGVVLVAAVPALRPRSGSRPTLGGAVATAVLSWEAVGVVAGGSYWLHYLVGTVPGLVLCAAVAIRRGGVRRTVQAFVVAYAGSVAALGVVATALAPIGTPAADLAVERYLSVHARPGDTGVVAFGDPALLQAAHLSSPYPELWSLPVRVRDPRLDELTHVLRSTDRPTWVVVDGDSLATWGVDAARAQPVLDRDYRLVQVDGDWHVFHDRTGPG
jgi:hypothetical protein